MKIEKYIVWVLCLLLVVPSVSAKKKPQQAVASVSVEREQQFTYYWYAAKKAITEERYSDAFVLLNFCEQLKPNDGKTLDFLGSMYDALGKKEKALDYYRRAYEADPRDQWYHYHIALLEDPSGNKSKEALQVLEKAYSLNSKDEQLLTLLVRFYTGMGKYKKALAAQDKLDALKGYDAYSAYARTRVYVFWEKPKKAIAEIDKYLENEPNDIQFLLYRVEIMEKSRISKKEELFAMYERILAIAPGNLMILNNYAYLLATHGGDLKKAERMSELTIREEPDNPVYLDTYGWILHLQGQDMLAKFYLQKAYRLADGEEVKQEIIKHLQQIP
ncbi:MAG: hypothetical protein II928_01610 [Paludibacteraceae bacterium]|nr:hypothetical protein [Paludibacteraceae bacterium]